MRTYNADRVRQLLDFPGCIAAMRNAMIELSRTSEPQPMRQIVPLSPGRMFGLMPGFLPATDCFGAKLVSVVTDQASQGRSVHRGLVALFGGEDGRLICTADGGAITEIRTACASAAATDVLARPDARVLTVLGCGTQARAHILALPQIRSIDRILLWGRDPTAAQALADSLMSEASLPVEPIVDARQAVEMADIVCTVSGAATPILYGAWVQPGTHVNLVGSSYLGPVECDSALVAASRYFVDYKPSALAAAAELALAIADGSVGPEHIAGEIGAVLAGTAVGRTAVDQITVYKSLGHVVQDLAAAAYVDARAASGELPL